MDARMDISNNLKTIQTMLDDVHNKYVKYILVGMHTIVFPQSIVFHYGFDEENRHVSHALKAYHLQK